ncbi:MAG: NUDIX hydrolase [Treponema sp.]|nr:NUDIX hydrolase [Treponema sp.]
MKKTKETELLKTPVFTVVKKEFQGTNFTPIGINCKDWVMIIALDSADLKKANTVFVRQSRWGIETKTVEFPCGTVESEDFSEGKDGNKVAALREFAEETGICIPEKNLLKAGEFNPNPAYFNNKMHVYYYVDEELKEKFEARSKQNLDENEDCEVFMARISDRIFFDIGLQIAGFCCVRECLEK